MDEAAILEVLKVLANPVRFRALRFLLEPPPSSCHQGDGVCGCDFEAVLGLAQPTVSHHLKQLVEVGLVRAEKRGRWTYYELVPAAFRELCTALAPFANAPEPAEVPLSRAARPIPGADAAELREGLRQVRFSEGTIEALPLADAKPEIVAEVDPADGAALLAAAGLPLSGWDAGGVRRWGVRDADRLLGVIALERHGDHGLLRSLAVAPEARGRGLAHALMAHALREAAALGLRDVAGLTTTIPDLLPRWGFREVARAALPLALAASPELQGACPASARVFVRDVAA